jgi:UDP-N-acetylglucosamine--N-acetylmuramyl-(pentapeptide) pyrophosphoryl-undecaprenol N-acetylglucosamine transferase
MAHCLLDMGERIVLTGGGTGGHVYPALAVAECLKNDSDVEAILYIGATGHVEERLAKEQGLEFVGLHVAGMPRKISPRLITWPGEITLAVARAHSVLKEFRPTAVLGTGGYASAPPLVAALTLKVPFAIHEPDAHPGLVNRSLGQYARLISLGMEGAKSTFKNNAHVSVFGNPISNRFSKVITRAEAAKMLDVDPDLPTLLITGGSQGAQAINHAVYEALSDLIAGSPSIQILHQVGEKNWDDMSLRLKDEFKSHPLYKPRKYFDNLAIAYAVSDLTVCRAGAMTIAELYATGTPAVFVPLPSAAQDHQTFNAKSVEEQGGAVVLPQSELNGERFARIVKQLIFDRARLDAMKRAMQASAKPNAAQELARALKAIGTKT